jgi:hypothetical protein
MKLLLLFVHEYWLRPYEPSLPAAPPAPAGIESGRAVAALIHVEAQDPERRDKLVTKSIKNIKWLAGKFETRTVILHSFAHLASTRAEPEQAEVLMAAVRERLETAGYTVHTTPFGWFNEFRLHVAGPSLAKVFVEL